MMEHSIYSVISPESCASILWADPKHAETAANGLKLDAKKALELEVIDKIIPEPSGGAHRNSIKAIANVKKYIENSLKELSELTVEQLLDDRFEKFRKIGNNTIIAN
jgi:acetyl-CoA carboxylase carboxyl transferase subunit alpha